MKKIISFALASSSVLALSGCVEFFSADGNCGSIEGEIHPFLALNNQTEGERTGDLGEFFGAEDRLIDNIVTAEYSFTSGAVTNAFAVRSLQFPLELGDFGPSSASNFAAAEGPVEYVSGYLVEQNLGEFDFLGFDTKPEVLIVSDSEGDDFNYLNRVAIDYSPLGGLIPTIGLPFGGPFEASFPFVLPVDVYAMCWDTPTAGDIFLYGEDESSGLLNNDDPEPAFSPDYTIPDSSSLRTYPGYEGDDFLWAINPDGNVVIEVLPTTLEFEDVTDALSVDYLNFAIVPWFEAMGTPTGNPAEDSARATYIWLLLTGQILDSAEELQEAFFLSSLVNLDYQGPFTLDGLPYSLEPEVFNQQMREFVEEQNADQIGLLESLGDVTRMFVQVSALETPEDNSFMRVKYGFQEISAITATTELQPVPYLGPVVTNDPETAQSGSTVTYTGSDLDDVTSATIAGQSAAIVAKTASSLTLRVPAGLSQGMHDVVLHYSTTESLTLQNGLVVQDLMKVWTQLQADNTVKMYAKNIIGEGKIQFFHNNNEIAWVRATNALNPKLRQANGSSYLVRTRELVAGKNAFEIYQDGKRIWRAAYSK